MTPERLARPARLLRTRAQLTQSGLASKSGVSVKEIRRLERGRAGRMRLEVAERLFASLGARLDLRVFWNGPELNKLLDAGHSALAADIKRRLERCHWQVQVEASFNHFGDRGRIDLLAFHPASRIVLVIEIKTAIVDVQDMLGSLDVKTRMARKVARDIGWEASSVTPALILTDDTATRATVKRLDSLFDRFTLRGRAALNWVRSPEAVPTGLLWFERLPAGQPRPGAQRVYRRRRP